MRSLTRAPIVVSLLYVAGAALAAQSPSWPQFRGPTGQGHAEAQNLPLVWSESRNVLWKTPVAGRGWSSPVVQGDRVWLTTGITEKNGTSLRAMAYDVGTGREVVNIEVFRPSDRDLLNQKNSHASPTPIIAGDRVFVHFGALGTAALTQAGEILWKKRFWYQSQHGAGGSPVLYDDLLIFSCDGDDQAFVIALETATGKTRWKTSRRYPFHQAYSTPLVIRTGERDELVSVGAFRTAAYDPKTGRELWRVSYDEGFSNVPRPVYGNGLVFITTGFQEPSLIAVRPGGSGDVTRTHVAWRMRRGAPYTPSPLLVGDELYVLSDLGIVSCLDAATGTVHWQHRIGGNYSASPIFAEGRIYFLNEEGIATVIAPGKTFRLLASNALDGGVLASMAVADSSILIRTHTHLYRIAAR